MLPFLPALLLLILRGPSALERAQPHAFPGSEAIYQNVAQRGVFMASRSHQGLHQTVIQLLRLMPLAPDQTEAVRIPEISVVLSLAGTIPYALRDGFFECERSRDGPRAV
jgi:hypothetical protein